MDFNSMFNELKAENTHAEPTTPTETNGEQTQEKTEPGPKTETPEAPKAPEVDRFKVLSETLGREFKSDEDVDTFKSSLTTTESQLSDYRTREEQWIKERDELQAGIDPMQYFASPELFVLNGLLKKFPDKNPMALTQITTQDFSKSHLDSPVKVLALDLMLEHPGIYANEAEAIEDIHARYNVTDPEEIEPGTLRRMKVDAKTAVDKFTQIKAEIKPPEKIDLTARQAEKQQKVQRLTADTETFFQKTLPGSLKAIEIPVTIKSEDGKESTEVAFKYDIPESYAKSKEVRELIESVRTRVVQNEAEWTPKREAELQGELSDLIMGKYFYKHRSEIYAALREDLTTKFADESWMKRHNVRPLRQDGTRPRDTDADRKQKENERAIAGQIGIKLPG